MRSRFDDQQLLLLLLLLRDRRCTVIVYRERCRKYGILKEEHFCFRFLPWATIPEVGTTHFWRGN